MKNKFDILLNVWVSLLISIVLSAVLPLLAGAENTFPLYFQGFVISSVVSYILATVLPVVKWGSMFAGLFKQNPRTLPGQLLSTIVMAFILGTFMSFTMTAINIGFPPFFMAAWLTAYPWALLVIYAMANISLWTGIPVVKRFMQLPDWPKHEAKDIS